MTGTALAMRPVMSVDITKVDYASGKSHAAKYLKAIGSEALGPRLFPGDQIGFNSGEWAVGWGDKKSVLRSDDDMTFVVNIPNAVMTWSTWKDSSSGRRYPHYEKPVFLALGDEIADREDLGDLDENEWECDKQGKPMDPWKAVLVFPVRYQDESTINHIMMSTKSAVIAALNVFGDVMEEMPAHAGQLPVIRVGSKKAERKIEVGTDRRGQPKYEVQKWDVPTYDIVGWVDAEECDNPGPNGVQVASGEGDGDVGEVEAQARVEKPAPSKKPTASAAPPAQSKKPTASAAPAKKGGRKQVSDDLI